MGMDASSWRVSKAPEVDELIRKYILHEALRPGDPLPTEPVLCEMLGCSRNRLREAIQRLQALDVLDVRHGIGTFVGQLSLRPLADVLQFSALVHSKVDRRAVRDILDVRIAVDRGMAPVLCSSVDPEDVPDLADLASRMDGLAANGQMLTELDREFHIKLAELTENNLAGQLVVAFWDVMEHIEVDLVPQELDEIERTARSHHQMLDCAVKGDLDGYYEALDLHYQSARRRLGIYVAAQPS